MHSTTAAVTHAAMRVKRLQHKLSFPISAGFNTKFPNDAPSVDGCSDGRDPGQDSALVQGLAGRFAPGEEYCSRRSWE